MAEASDSSYNLWKELDSVQSIFKSHNTIIIESCHKELVQVKLRLTQHKQILLKIQFPVDYPRSILLIEYKSRYISETLLKGMENVCEKHLKEDCLGSPQIAKACLFLNDFLINNPFTVCSDEVTYIKNTILRHSDEYRSRPKQGVIHYKAVEGLYFIEFSTTVPNEYPSTHVKLEIKRCNFPNNIEAYIKGQSQELLRQCTEPPVRKKKNVDHVFEPQPSLRVMYDFLVINCIRYYPSLPCPYCEEQALPSDPMKISLNDGDPSYVYRMYCGHLYHRKCLDIYMKTPPFEGGKKCIICHQRLSHDKWNVPPKIAEDRWARQQAKEREIAEVAEFLGFD